jgi:hypothetical protein
MSDPIQWMRDEAARLNRSQYTKWEASGYGLDARARELAEESHREYNERIALERAIELYEAAHPPCSVCGDTLYDGRCRHTHQLDALSPDELAAWDAYRARCTLVAGSPIEPGDRIEIVDGVAHASPRRHDLVRAEYGSAICNSCLRGFYGWGDNGECPGPPRSTQGKLVGPLGGG